MKKIYSLLLALVITTLTQLNVYGQYSWSNVGTGMNSPVQSLTTDTTNDILYAGGVFTQAGGIPAIDIAKWDGVTWAPLGGGVLSGSGISSLLMQGTELIAGGTFTNIGGVLSKNIAKWDGLIWTPIGAGLDYTGVTTVSTLTMYNGDLYAGGTFNVSGATTVNNIARWDGTNWQPLTTGTNGKVLSLYVFGTDLYVGGSFTDAGGVVVNNIAKWDGTTWSDVGGGVSYTGVTTVATLTEFNGDLYVGGTFTTAGATPVKHIAKWDGAVWSDVGGGASSYTGVTTVATFTTFNNELIVGGNFDTLGFAPASYIGKWDGTVWTTLSSGTNNTVLALATMHDTLYAGGLFPVAGGNAAPFIAEWIPSPVAFISATDMEFENGKFVLYPNPLEDRLYFKNMNDVLSKDRKIYSFILFDLMGREIMRTNKIDSEILFERNHIPSGLYIYKIIDTEKILVQQGKLSFR